MFEVDIPMWNEMLRYELQCCQAQEREILPIFHRFAEVAQGEPARAILQELCDAGPARQGRLEIVFALADWPELGEPPAMLEGWRRDGDALVKRMECGDASDAALLAMIVKLARTRTACYEVAYLLAKETGMTDYANLIGPLWTEDRETDNRVSDALSSLIARERVA